MKKATLCYCIKKDQVLLAMKKVGFGKGKWNGYGGKFRSREKPKIAAAREIKEESGLIATPENLEQVALIRFYFDGVPVFECYIFLAYTWQGEPIETKEMKPRWFPISRLPFKKMWAADVLWIPLILAGKKIEAEVNFNTDGSVVKKFEHKPAKFG